MAVLKDNDKAAGSTTPSKQTTALGVGGGQYWALAFGGGNWQWCLKILVMVSNETTGNGYLMDVMMDCSKEVAWQQQQGWQW